MPVLSQPSSPEPRHLVASKLRYAATQLRHLPGALGLVWTAAPGWTAGWVTLLVGQGLLPLAVVCLTRPLVDGLLAAVRAGGDWPSLRRVLLLAALMGAALLLTEALRVAAGWVCANQSELVQDHIQGLIHRQSAAVDLAFYDSAEFYDQLHRARAEASYRPVALVESLGSLFQNGVTLAAMLAVLIPFGAWLPAVLFLSTLPALWVVLRYAVRQHQWRLGATAMERRTWYYDWLLTARESAQELRLFGLGEKFQSSYRDLRRRLRTEKVALARSQGAAEFGAGVLALGMAGACLLWMLWRAVQGQVSVGALAQFTQAFQQGLRLMRTLLENTGQLYYNSLFLGNLFEFLALKPRVLDPPHPRSAPEILREGICFERVTFRYPGADRATLDEFSLTIPAGRISAIVGPNGSGKSTVVKLLCRFYDPQEGRVRLDGTDIRELPLSELRRRLAVQFQEPVRYNATAAENVALGDAAREPHLREIQAASHAAGADEVIIRLSQGYDHLLGRLFVDGAELSTGEWHRLALARAFVRKAPIVILDEPTGNMDPWAEAEWLERLRDLAQGRTALLITHRLTTAMRTDMIFVLMDGQLVEAGTHADLVARGGLYARTWCEETAPA
jgi:ATP-binding cassette subfamily B protein